MFAAVIGNAVHDVASFSDDPKNMYLGGVMGGACMVAFGVAIAQPKRRILVITGDGELLAGVGSLATIGVEKPDNLSIIVIDNEAHHIPLDGHVWFTKYFIETWGWDYNYLKKYHNDFSPKMFSA